MMRQQHMLNEATIRDRVGAESFNRGQRYFREGRIVNARRAGSTLSADCYGSGDNIYRVQATVEKGRIVEADCSCPVGAGGYCKHVAALLLTWLAQPKDFRAVEETDNVLERRSKEELIALVKQMLRRAPELESLLEVPMPTGKKSKEKVDPKALRRQVAAAFRGYDDYYGAEASVANDLSPTLELGEGYLEQGELENAATVFEAVADGVLEHYEEFHDESGELGATVQRAVEGLGNSLTEVTGPALREQILRALFEVYRFDVDFGGVGLSDEVPRLILEQADAAEKQQVAEWVRAAMKKQTGHEFSDNWHRQVYGGFLLELEAAELDDEAYLRLCRETHRLNDLVDRLLTWKRADEATREAAQASDYELLGLAEDFARHKQTAVVERLIADRAPQSQDTRLAEWLMKRRAAKGDHAGAVSWARRIYDVRPSLVEYQRVREFASELGTWDTVRAELLAQLQKKKEHTLLTQIHLDEKDLDAALETVAKIQAGFGYYYPDLRLQVAKAAEETHPREALRIYLQAAEDIVKARNRAAYEQAVKYLLRVRQLYDQLGQREVWEQYLRKLKEETKALRAFKAELAKAKL